MKQVQISEELFTRLYAYFLMDTRRNAPRERRSRHRSRKARTGHCKPQKAKFGAIWNGSRGQPDNWQR